MGRNINLMSDHDFIDKTAGVVKSVVGAIPKFKSGETLEIFSGSLDIATAILDFAPPPSSIIAGKTLDFLRFC